MDAAIRLVPVQARGKKHARAEPTAALYEAGKVKHMPLPEGPGLDQLESQQATWEPTDRESPDRIDALVHLVEFLFKGSGATNIIRAGSMPWAKGRR
jgi:phage terminase large subunit-like protein